MRRRCQAGAKLDSLGLDYKLRLKVDAIGPGNRNLVGKNN
jgi:hypothetical protein